MNAPAPRPMPLAPDITVIIATRNRADSLRETLDRVAAQQTGGQLTYEVLVVDNGSTDHTRRLVEGLREGFPVPLRYLAEERIGKPWALNAGMAQARGKLLAFLDDDALAARGWLHALWTCACEERADAVAGRVLPLWTAPKPAWLTDELLRHLNQLGLGCVDHGDARRRTSDGHDCRWVGSSMAIRRRAVKRVGGFHTGLLRGQDSEYYECCTRRGLRVAYEPQAVVHHKIGPERLTPEAFRAWRARQGAYAASTLPWKASHLVTVLPVWRWAVTARCLLRWLAAVLARRSGWERFHSELRLREELGLVRRRLALWPRQWRITLTRRGSRL